MATLKRCLLASIVLMLLAASSMLSAQAVAAPVTAVLIKPTGNRPFPRVLSDLILYDDAGNKKELSKPNDASDDRRFFTARETHTFIGGFLALRNVRRMVVSELIDGKERETAQFKILIDPTVEQERKLIYGFLIDPIADADVFLSIDLSVSSSERLLSLEGQDITFTGGSNPSFSGWFAGTSIDFDTGEISSGYTGTARVASLLEVSLLAIPEPDTALLLTCTLLALGRRAISPRGSGAACLPRGRTSSADRRG